MTSLTKKTKPKAKKFFLALWRLLGFEDFRK